LVIWKIASLLSWSPGSEDEMLQALELPTMAKKAGRPKRSNRDDAIVKTDRT
jgi:hypothetical protein